MTTFDYQNRYVFTAEIPFGVPGDFYRSISESPRSLEHMQKKKKVMMGSRRFFID
jgi:hypothetical protein